MFKKKVKDFFRGVKTFIVEEYKFLLFMGLFYIICTWPVNYYIVIGGGISDVSSRIEVSDEYDSKGSFNLSYVSELKGTLSSYLLSYIIPTWDRENINDYKYSEEESYDDIEFRGDIDLKSANANAIKAAYSLASKPYKEISSKIYVIATFDEYKTNLKVQDEIIGINGNAFKTLDEYSKYIQQLDIEDDVVVKVIRNGKEEEIKCKLNEDKGVKLLGVALQIVKDYETDPKIEIKFEASESGPSGGLITALEIYNSLVEKDITYGLKIAGTGTISEDGKVGTIGGVRHKVIGAAAGDADVFLVPAGENYEETKKTVKEKKLDIKVIPVETLEEAIDELSKLKK